MVIIYICIDFVIRDEKLWKRLKNTKYFFIRTNFSNFLNLNISTYAESGLDDEINVKVITMPELKEALSNYSISTIAVTSTIYLNGNDLGGKGKTIRTEKNWYE